MGRIKPFGSSKPIGMPLPVTDMTLSASSAFTAGEIFPMQQSTPGRRSARGFGTAEPTSIEVPGELLQVFISESCDGPDHSVRDRDALMAREQQCAAPGSSLHASREDVDGRDRGVLRPRCFSDEYGPARRRSRTRKVDLDALLDTHALPG